LANIEKLPNLPQHTESQLPSTEAACNIPNDDAAKSDSVVAVEQEAGSVIDGESTAATSQNDTTATTSNESAP